MTDEKDWPRISPSRAKDFKSCPQLFKYRAIDKREEEKSPVAAMGNLVHWALEELYALEPASRTLSEAQKLLLKGWDERRELKWGRFDDSEEEAEWSELEDKHFRKASALVDNYFEMEDPTLIKPVKLEWELEVPLDGIILRGFIDRVDEVEGGLAIVDYKTGKTPSEKYEMSAFFGLRFYALACWKGHGFIPKEIRLLYLDSKTPISLEPSEGMLRGYQKQISAIQKAIARATANDDWRTRPGGLCKTCSFLEICPAWDGITPPWLQDTKENA